MNVAYLKVTCGLRFHLFFLFFFSAPRLLMSFHGHSCPSIISSPFSSKHEVRAVEGMARHVFFLSNWAPRVGALSKLRTLHIGSNGTGRVYKNYI